MLQQLILFIHLLLALVMIGLVLIQQGKGADAGAAFGSGASGTVFGSAGSGSFLTRTTTVVAALFAVTSISLTLLANKGRSATLTDKLLQQETTVSTPVAASPAEPVAAPAAEIPTVPSE